MSKKKNETENIPFPSDEVTQEVVSTVNDITQPTQNLFERDARGLIKNYNYIFTPEGRVNWRAMLKPEHLYVNSKSERLSEEFLKKYGKEARFCKTQDIVDLNPEDKFLLINLAGIKFLAHLRGIESYRPTVNNVIYDNNYRCVVSCTITANITFIENFETKTSGAFGFHEYSGIGGASLANTFDFAQRYIETIAENRAFVRAIRNYLGINIVGFDEIGPDQGSVVPNVNSTSSAIVPDKVDQTPVTGHNPVDALQQKCLKMNITFSQLKSNCSKKYKSILSSNPEDWDSWLSISQEDVYRILSKIKESESK